MGDGREHRVRGADNHRIGVLVGDGGNAGDGSLSGGGIRSGVAGIGATSAAESTGKTQEGARAVVAVVGGVPGGISRRKEFLDDVRERFGVGIPQREYAQGAGTGADGIKRGDDFGGAMDVRLGVGEQQGVGRFVHADDGGGRQQRREDLGQFDRIQIADGNDLGDDFGVLRKGCGIGADFDCGLSVDIGGIQNGHRAGILNHAVTEVAEDGPEQLDGLIRGQGLFAADIDGAVHLRAGPEINDEARGAAQVTQDLVELRATKVEADVRAGNWPGGGRVGGGVLGRRAFTHTNAHRR